MIFFKAPHPNPLHDWQQPTLCKEGAVCPMSQVAKTYREHKSFHRCFKELCSWQTIFNLKFGKLNSITSGVVTMAGPHGWGLPLEAASKERHNPGGANYTKGKM